MLATIGQDISHMVVDVFKKPVPGPPQHQVACPLKLILALSLFLFLKCNLDVPFDTYAHTLCF